MQADVPMPPEKMARPQTSLIEKNQQKLQFKIPVMTRKTKFLRLSALCRENAWLWL